MEQLEKVCKGLEYCVLRDPDDHRRCGECPYNPHAISNEPCANGLKYNALALIRQQQERIAEMEAAQTARVMTLEEVFCCKDPFYLEYGGGCIVCWAISCCHFQNSIHMTTQNGSHVELYNVKYGKSWRCWTQRPTDEQREAAKWE